MGKQVLVTATSGYVLPVSTLYQVGNTVVLSTAMFNSLPSAYVSDCLTVLGTVADPPSPYEPEEDFDFLTPAEGNAAYAPTVGSGNYPARKGGSSSTAAPIPILNAEDFGGSWDGVGDDSVAIMAAYAEVDPNRGGRIILPFVPKSYWATGVVFTIPGTEIIASGGQTGVSDDLAKGSTQIIVGDGQWGLTVGVDGTSDFRGYSVDGLHFFEKNAGQGLGGLQILSSSNGSYKRVAGGSFTAGHGFLLNGHSGSVQAQYNTFTDCRVGKCAVGFENQFANGTRWIGGYADGSHNGQTPTASSVGFKLTSGDTFRSFGTVIQGYDTLVSCAAVYNPEFHGTRFEVWTTAAISIASGCNKGKFYGDGDNSLMSNAGTGAVIASGAADIEMGATFRNVHTLYSDSGTRTRYPGRSGPSSGASVLGSVVGKTPQYDPLGNLLGYSPIYNTISGLSLVQKLGGNTNNASGVTTVTRTLTAPANIGDLVVIGGGYGGGSTQTITITDTRGNAWTVDRHDDLTTSTTPHSFIAHSVLTTALQVGDVITVTFGGSVNYPILFCYDYTGQNATVVDTSGGATGTGTTPSTGNITTTSNSPLLFAAAYFNQTATFTVGSGFTSLDSATTTSKTLNTEAENGPAAGTFVGATGTLSGSVDWAISVVAFKSA